MSYILDALRRADAERGLGRAPDLHAQPLPPNDGNGDARSASGPGLWLAGGLALGLLAAWLALAWWRPAPETGDAEVTRAAVPVAAPTAAPDPPVPTPSPVPPPQPVAAAVPPAAPPLASLPPLPDPPRPSSPAAPPAARPAATAVAPPPPSLRELPDLQHELPPIVVGGSVYSEQPSARMLVLNGRVFREGETIAPDLVLEQIGPRSAVLRWRDRRFSLP